MDTTTFIGLINNAALLLALGLLYDTITLKQQAKKPPVQVLTGVILGAMGIAVMMNPWEFTPGVVFDTRSVLLSVGGFFFGSIPTLMAVLMTGAYRLYQGGAGAWTGVAVIITSGGIGVGWKHLRRKWLKEISSLELYILGIVVHIAMLLWMLSLPWSVAIGVLSKISLPVMTLYPVGTVLLGNLMLGRLARKQAEEALRENEKRFKHLVKNSNDMIIIIDENGKETYINDSVERVTGFSPEELLNHSVFEFLHPNDVDHMSKTLSKLLKLPGGTVQDEYRHRRKDGGWVCLEAIVTNYLHEPSIKGIVLNVRDITERKRIESKLKQNENMLRQIIDTTPNCIYVKDRNGMYLVVNKRMAELHSTTPEELVGKHDYEIAQKWFETVDYNEFRKAEQDVIDNKKTLFIKEEPFVYHDGTERWFQTTKIPFEPEDNQNCLLVISVDITERKQAEEERELLLAQIRAQAKQIQQTIDTVPEGVLLLDTAQRVMLANPVAEGDLAVLAGARVGDILTRLGDRPLAELLTSPPTKGLWHEVKTDGRTFEVIARPMENGPEPENWVLVINDVTQERETRQRIQQQERLVAVGQLAAGIAHDFNNIMATIVLYAQMTMREREVSTRVRERMETINQQARHATRLTQQILDFSRRAVLERQPLNLLPLLKEQIKLLQRTLPENIEISLDYGPDEYTVNADPTRVQQAITNLSVNARDAMPGGGELRIGLERIQIEERQAAPLPEMEAGEWVQVRISDTGTGIPPDALPHIFEPFFTTRAPLGSGLGLAQVHGIVAQHEGYIDVETQLGQGTAFTIYLPALPAYQPEVSTQKTMHLIQGEGQTILVVEDNAAMRKALVESLELLNYQVLEAANGREALTIMERQTSEDFRSLEEGKIALVLSDMVMPGMGGQALFQALRQWDPTVKVVLLTGHPLEKELENLQAQGLSGWLLKPPMLEQLAQVVAGALNLCSLQN